MLFNPWSWWIAAGALAAAELLVGTFYLLMLALGCVAGGLAHAFGAPPAMQYAVAAVVALVALLLLRRSRFERKQRRDASADPDINLDIGATLEIPDWHDGHARVPYRGSEWDVELASGERADARFYQVCAVRGNCLVMAAKPSR